MIQFGTDGWRAVVGEEFTIPNVQKVAWAIGKVALGKKIQKGILVGFDRRNLSKEAALTVVDVLTSLHIPVWFVAIPFPTPAISFGVHHLKLDWGVVITSSHNPPEWNGIKIKESTGAPAALSTTKAVESWIPKFPDEFQLPRSDQKNRITVADLKDSYLQFLESKVDWKIIRDASPHVVVDYMHGSAAGLLGELLRKKGISVSEVRTAHDPSFGGVAPEPLEKNLKPLTAELGKMAPSPLVLGFALDGDGDRIAVIDPEEGFISAHYLFAILLHHLVMHKKKAGRVVKTFNISFLIDEMARNYKLPLEVVPIGFKYIAEQLLRPDTLIGGEESGGIGIKQEVPERDGALNALYLLEAACAARKTLGGYVEDLFSQYGARYYARRDIHMPREKIESLLSRFRSEGTLEMGGIRFTDKAELDGIKWISDSGWILFRPSGTEPLIRIYAELRDRDKLPPLLDAAAEIAEA